MIRELIWIASERACYLRQGDDWLPLKGHGTTKLLREITRRPSSERTPYPSQILAWSLSESEYQRIADWLAGSA